MKFRYLKESDLPAIREINTHPDHRYDLDSPNFVFGGVIVDDDDKIIGFGGVRILYEPVMILDFKQSKKTRISAARELLVNGIQHSIAYGVSYWHAFCDKEFAAFLVKWFDFRPADGTAIILDIEGGHRVEERRESDEAAIRGGPCIGEEQVWGLHRGAKA
jgi:hypothetical protein